MFVLTCDRRKVDAHQESEECGNVIGHVWQVDVHGGVWSRNGWVELLLHQQVHGSIASPHVLCSTEVESHQSLHHKAMQMGKTTGPSRSMEGNEHSNNN